MKRTRMARAAVAAAALAALAGCTPDQVDAWKEWYRDDPEAAVDFARQPDVQASLRAANQRGTQSSRSSGGGTVWDRLAQCESGGNWSINTGNGYYGGLQFLPSTWRSAGGSGMPHHASREEQIRVAENLRDSQGFRPWPQCARRLGLL